MGTTHFNELRSPVHIWGECTVRRQGEITRFDSKVHWSDRPVIDYFDPDAEKICSVCATKHRAIMHKHEMALMLDHAQTAPTATDPAPYTSYMYKVSAALWLGVGIVYLIMKVIIQ